MDITLRFDASTLREKLKALANDKSVIDKTYEKIGEKLLNDFNSNIDNSKDINGNALTPNAPSTIRRKKSSKPLIDTGELRRSGGYYKRSGALIVTYHCKGVKFNNFGTTTLPRRKFFGLNKQQKKDISNIFVEEAKRNL